MSIHVQFEENDRGSGPIQVTFKGDFVGTIERLEQNHWKFTGPSTPNGISADGRSEMKRQVELHFDPGAHG